MTQPVISEEQAMEEFRVFAEEFEIDINEDNMSEEDLAQFLGLKKIVIRAMMKGRLIFDDNCNPTYTTRNSNDNGQVVLKFREPRASDIVNATKANRGKVNDEQKSFAMMASVCGQDVKVITKLGQRDLNVCMAIFGFFTSAGTAEA